MRFSHWSRALRAAVCAATALTELSAAQAQSAVAATRPSSATVSGWVRVRGDRVNLRARPDRNAVVVAVATDGDVLEALGGEFGWRRVVPPPGVFSLVAAEFVEMDDVGRAHVRVSSGKLRVRVGSLVSDVDPLKADVQTWLADGAEVRVIERGERWLKIVPPDDVALYVDEQHVAALPADQARGLVLRAATAAPASNASGRPASADRPAAPVSQPGAPAPRRTVAVDLTGPWGRRLATAESDVDSESGRPVLERDWEPHIRVMRTLAAQREDPVVSQLAEAWVQRLEDRVAEQDLLRRAKQAAQRAEQIHGELAAAGGASASAAPRYDAIGLLLPSAAGGRPRRYRLVDPITRSLVAYVEFEAAAASRAETHLRRCVGVWGTRVHDAAAGADVIHATAYEPVAPGSATSQPTASGHYP